MRELSESDCLSQKKRQKVLLRNSGIGTTLISPPHCPLLPVAETLGRLCLVQKGEKTKQNKKKTAHLEVTAWLATFYGI